MRQLFLKLWQWCVKLFAVPRGTDLGPHDGISERLFGGPYRDPTPPEPEEGDHLIWEEWNTRWALRNATENCEEEGCRCNDYCEDIGDGATGVFKGDPEKCPKHSKKAAKCEGEGCDDFGAEQYGEIPPRRIVE